MSFKTTVSVERPARVAGDVLVLLFRGGNVVSGNLPPALEQEVKAQMRARGFTGAWGGSALFPLSLRTAASMVAVVGLGNDEDAARRAEGLRRGVAAVLREARSLGARSFVVVLGDDEAATQTRAVVEAVHLADYVFADYSERLRKQQARQKVQRLTIVVAEEQRQVARAAAQEAEAVASGVRVARELVNQPAEQMSPHKLVEVAREIADKSSDVSLKVMNKAQAQRAGFSAFLAVARGSEMEPQVIHLVYKPKNRSDVTKRVVLVGKGITFDSGGLSLKPAEAMEAMKIDMAGAATVLGAFSVMATVAPDVEVHGVIAACENMPSGTAYRPGDILTAKNGKTIEVLNTDAEGRVTLADALSYAVEQEPDAIVDLATLTGACMVALGETVAGVWSNDETVEQGLVKAAEVSGEGLETMPMPDEYRQLIESSVADLRNAATSRYGGAITAAMFLREFVGKTPWAHIDIAGPSFIERPAIAYWDKGATGYGVRTLIEFLKKFA